MNKLSQFLIYCSGVTLTILKKSPTEFNKYIDLGATILFTGILATMAATYAITLLSSSIWVAISIGTIWGLMIFNLDRLIMSSIPKTGNLKTDFIAVSPRILLATFISLVIATPLELRLFESEIDDELQLINKASYDNSLTKINIQYDTLEARINREIDGLTMAILEKEKQRDHLIMIVQSEADGTGGSGKKNLGPIYQLKNRNLKRIAEELDHLRYENKDLIQQKRKEIKTLVIKKENAIAHIIKPKANGIAARMVALDNLATKNNIVYWIKIFITVLFIIVETTPILLKLMMRKGPYDVITRSMEDKVIARYIKA